MHELVRFSYQSIIIILSNFQICTDTDVLSGRADAFEDEAGAAHVYDIQENV